jgi:XTP/dITP diphosphohydrolase
VSGKVTSGARHALLVATQNKGKLEELRALLADLAVDVLSPADAGVNELVVKEDGATFEANAAKKARAYANATMMLTLADDSGLEVDALGGAPGVRSARYAGETATDAENNSALLAALGALDPSARAGKESGFPARFRCVLALCDPYADGGEPALVLGRCEGAIVASPRGGGGFGYDPLFVVGSGERTMAELGAEEKNRVSHRAQAFQKLRPVLEKTLLVRNDAIRRILGP